MASHKKKYSFLLKNCTFWFLGFLAPRDPQSWIQTFYSWFQLFTQWIIDFWEKIKYSSTDKFFRPFSNLAIFCLFWPFFGPIGPKLAQIGILSICLHSNLCCGWFPIRKNKYFSSKLAIFTFGLFGPPWAPKGPKMGFFPFPMLYRIYQARFHEKIRGSKFYRPKSPSESVIVC